MKEEILKHPAIVVSFGTKKNSIFLGIFPKKKKREFVTYYSFLKQFSKNCELITKKIIGGGW
jgi:hypothetical protein